MDHYSPLMVPVAVPFVSFIIFCELNECVLSGKNTELLVLFPSPFIQDNISKWHSFINSTVKRIFKGPSAERTTCDLGRFAHNAVLIISLNELFDDIMILASYP